MKIKFKIICNYNSDYNIYRITNDIWNIEKKFDTTYSEDYTHLIVFNRIDRNITTDKKNIYGFIHEPYTSGFFDRDLPLKCNKVFYYDRDKLNYEENVIDDYPLIGLHHLFPKPYDLHEIQYINNNTYNIINSNFQKNKKLSIIVSSITHERYDYVKMLLNSDIDFDFYGRDWQITDRRYKGYITNKIDGIKNYKYTISLESKNIKGLISEKFIDSILCRTIPIYNGHCDIEKFYPNSCEYINLDNNFVLNIRKIIEKDKKYDEYNIDDSINLYLNKYNPFEIVTKYIQKENE